MTPDEFLEKAYDAAIHSGHIFPEYAVCEAALESNWGNSRLAREGNSLFGQKQSKLPIYGTLTLPTKEYIGGEWVAVSASWVAFPDWAHSFSERMVLLRRLAPKYPHYAAALAAPNGETFVREVSKTWSTDPQRAEKVLAIHKKHMSGPADHDSEIAT